MRIAYLLGDTGISATARIVLAQADALIAKNHQVRIVTTGLPLTWRSSLAEWVYVDDLRGFVPEPGEIVVDPKVVQDNPIVDDDFYRERLPRENEPLRVLLCGGSPSISEGYGAAAHARWFHQKFDLIRVSPWAPSREMTRLVHSCDVLIAPNRRDDPQSLTTLEALASSLACVVTATPQHLAIDTDYALFAPPDNAVELGEKLIEVLSNQELRQRLRAAGREVAEQWRSVNVATRLEKLLSL